MQVGKGKKKKMKRIKKEPALYLNILKFPLDKSMYYFCYKLLFFVHVELFNQQLERSKCNVGTEIENKLDVSIKLFILIDLMGHIL